MLREVQLKPESADLFPMLSPGRWYTAAAIAGLVKGTRIILEGPATPILDRILNPAHFEFRGGRGRGGSWAGMRTRRLDRQTTGRRRGGQATPGQQFTA